MYSKTFQRAVLNVCHTPSSDIYATMMPCRFFFGAIGLLYICRKLIVHHQYSTTSTSTARGLILSTTKSKPYAAWHVHQCINKFQTCLTITYKMQQNKNKNLPTTRYTNDVDGSKGIATFLLEYVTHVTRNAIQWMVLSNYDCTKVQKKKKKRRSTRM